MQEVQIASFDGVPVRVHHSALRSGSDWLVIALPVGTKPSLVAPSLQRLSARYNVLTWEARLILEPEVALPEPDALSIDAHLQDLDLIARTFGLSRAFLIGYCSGAALALHAAARSPWVRALALVNGAYFRQDADCDRTQYEKDVMALMPAVAGDRAIATMVFQHGTKLVRSTEDALAAEFRRPYLHADSLYRFAVALRHFMDSDLRMVARGIDAPALVATGHRDDRTHYTSSLLFASELGRARTLVDEDGDHYEFSRANPELLDALDDFFHAC